MRAFVAVSVLLLLCWSRGAAAEPVESDPDLAAIPPSVLTAQPTPPASAPRSDRDSRLFLESALTGWERRTDLPVPSPNAQPTVQERLSFDVSYNWNATPALRFVVSDRLNAFVGDDLSPWSSGNLRNDLREAFASYEIRSQTFLEIGRINLRNGPALGYNPTDFFKPRTQVSLASIDPSAARQNRLGVVMAEAQKLFARGAVTFAVAPAVQHASSLPTRAPASFDPQFSQTNSSPRYLGSLSYDLLGLSPQVLVFHDNVGTHWGASVSEVLTNSVVAYAEWSGVDSGSLSQRAITFGQTMGTLPPNTPLLPQSAPAAHFQNDAAVGASWTSSYRLTVNVEFHYHQSGFTQRDFDRWLALGSSSRQLADEMWFVRAYAMDQQEPLMRREIFVRLDWQDAFIRYLDLGVVSFVNPVDRSALAQLSAQYALSPHWTFGVYATTVSGGTNRENGSIPWSKSVALQIIRYF